MKNRKQYVLLLALCAAATFGSVALGAAEGIDRGNGGDETSQSFVATGYELVESLMKDPVAGVDTAALYRAVQATKVNSEERLELRGFEVDAINYPDADRPRIVVSRTGWERLAATPHKRVFLAFHEYLHIMGIDDSNYQVSSRLDRARVCDRSAPVREAIERELKKSCYRIIPDDLRYVEDVTAVRSNLPALLKSDFAGLNLRTLRIWENPELAFDSQALRHMSRMEFLGLGSSVPDLSDCAFLANFPVLSSLWLSDSVYYRDITKFRPLRRIEPGCFARIRSPNLESLMLSIDGRTTEWRGALAGLRLTGHLQIDGMHFETLDPAEFSRISVFGVVLTAYDSSLTAEKVKAIGDSLGMVCELGGQIVGSTPSPSYTCRKR